MKEPVSLNPDAKSILDAALSDKVAADKARHAAEAERVQQTKDALAQGSRYLEQVALPAMEVLAAYLNEKNIAAKIQPQKAGSKIIDLQLNWGKSTKDPMGFNRTTRAQQNTFRMALKPDGSLVATSALLGEDFEEHKEMPTPLTGDWVQTEAAEVIKRSIGR